MADFVKRTSHLLLLNYFCICCFSSSYVSHVKMSSMILSSCDDVKDDSQVEAS
jgi:hypothetical protein